MQPIILSVRLRFLCKPRDRAWWRRSTFLTALVITQLGILSGACNPSPPSPRPKSQGTPIPLTPSEAPKGSMEPSHAPTHTAQPPTNSVITTARASAEPTKMDRLCSPLADHALQELPEILTNPFEAPRPGRDDGHHGVDFSYYRRGERDTIHGVLVESMLPGIVAAVIGDRIPYGNMVIVETPSEALDPSLVAFLDIQTDESLYLLYAHLEGPIQVSLREPVRCGEILAAVGNTGWSGNPHLHLESRIGPAREIFAEMAYYDTRATLEEMENYRRWRMSGLFRLVDPMVLIARN